MPLPTRTPPDTVSTGCECPSRAELQALLHGDLDAGRSDELTVHVGDCPGCQGEMEAVASGEVPSLPTLVRHLPQYEPPPSLWKAIDRVVVEVTRTGAYQALPRSDSKVTPVPADVDDDLAFLTPTTLPDRIGTFGPFEVIRLIGRGGMGVVLHAFDPDLQRDVALKVLDPDLSSNRTARARFCREARAAASVTHENIVTVHQVNEDERSGLPYLVMQLINGESLEQRLRRVGQMGVPDAARLGAQAAAGLAAAHAQGLIHRDVKPGNILIEAGDRVKLTDFGLARAAEDLKLTRTGYVSGTPLYMAPEQARGDEVDARADLFSLGVVLYEAVAGKPPFDGKTPLAVLREVADTPHRPLRKLAPNVPDWFEDVVDGLLAKTPADRLNSASEVAAVLAAHTAGLNGTCDSAPSVPCPVVPGTGLSKVAKRKYRRRLLAVMAMPFLLGLGVGGVGVWGLLGGVRPAAVVAPPADTAPVSPPPAVAAPAVDAAKYVLEGDLGSVWSVAACGDGRTLAVGTEDGTVRLYDLSELGTSRRVKVTSRKHKGPVWGIDFHPKNHHQFVTASDDGTVKLWDTESQESKDIFTGPTGVRAVAYSPDGDFLAVGERNGSVKVFAVAGDTPLARPVREFEHGSSLTAIAFAPTGSGSHHTLATAGSDKVVRVWDTDSRSADPQLTLPGHRGPVYAVAFSRDGKKIATGGWGNSVILWDAESGTEEQKLEGNEYGVWSLAFTPCCGYLASAGQDGSVRIWNTKTGKEEGKVQAHRSVAHVVRYTRETPGMPVYLMSGGRDGAVRLWEVEHE
jgi:eukaryotic-like serine/threonine-protein kinase